MPLHLTPGRASRLGLIAASCLLTLVAGSARVPAQGVDPLEAALALERRYQEVIAEVEPAVVSIARINPDNRGRVRENFDPLAGTEPGIDGDPHHPEFVPNEFGSGVIVAPQTPGAVADRLVLTAYHVVKGGQVYGERPGNGHRLVVRFADRVSCDAAIVAADPLSDLAVLRLYTAVEAEGTPTRYRGYPGDVGKLKAVRLDLADETRKGSFVLVFGNPYAVARDGSASVARGMVSNSHRRPAPLETTGNPQARREQTIHHFGTLLQLDARLNLGTSGGAVVNLRGDLVGLTVAAAALDGYEKSAGYAIPINAGTRRVIDELAHGYEVEYGLLGVTLATIHGRDFIHEAGQPSAIKLNGLIDGSPAARAGLQRDDVILAVNGQPVLSHYDLIREIGLLGPGNQAVLRVMRAGRKISPVTVRELGKWPVVNSADIIATRERHGPWDIGPYREVRVDYPTGRYRFFQDDFYRAAVVVTGMAETTATTAPDGPQALRVGDFITHVGDTPTPTPKEFAQAIERARNRPLRLRRLDKPEVRINP